MRTVVKLTYFHPDGKYFGSGIYSAGTADMKELRRQIKNLKDYRTLPGLTKGHPDFHVYVELLDPPSSISTLLPIGE